MTATRASRLTPERQAEILDAVIELVRQVGYEALTMDAVAAAAHTSKATLYRQWTDRPGLVVAALEHYHPHTTAAADTGTLRGDLVSLVADIKKTEPDTDLIAGLVRAVFLDEELRDAIQTRLLDPGIAELDAVLQRAVDRGEVAADCPALTYIGHVIVSFGLAHKVLRGHPATSADLTRLIDDVVLPALSASA